MIISVDSELKQKEIKLTRSLSFLIRFDKNRHIGLKKQGL